MRAMERMRREMILLLGLEASLDQPKIRYLSPATAVTCPLVYFLPWKLKYFLSWKLVSLLYGACLFPSIPSMEAFFSLTRKLVCFLTWELSMKAFPTCCRTAASFSAVERKASSLFGH